MRQFLLNFLNNPYVTLTSSILFLPYTFQNQVNQYIPSDVLERFRETDCISKEVYEMLNPSVARRPII